MADTIPYMNFRELTKELHKQDFELIEQGQDFIARKGEAAGLTIHKASINGEGPIYRSLISGLVRMGFVAPAARKRVEIESKKKVAPEGFDPQCPYCSRNDFKLPMHKGRHITTRHPKEWARDHPEEVPKPVTEKPEPKAVSKRAGPVTQRQVQPESKAHQIKLLSQRLGGALRTVQEALPDMIRITEELEEENASQARRLKRVEDLLGRAVDEL